MCKLLYFRVSHGDIRYLNIELLLCYQLYKNVYNNVNLFLRCCTLPRHCISPPTIMASLLHND